MKLSNKTNELLENSLKLLKNKQYNLRNCKGWRELLNNEEYGEYI